jgi:cytochrome c553
MATAPVLRLFHFRSTFGAASLLAALAALSPVAAAPPASSGATIVRHGAPEQGLFACVNCHGANAEGNAALGAPRLAGVGSAYLLEQLDAFAQGRRDNVEMAAIANSLSPAERNAVALYLAALPAPPVATGAPASLAAGAALAQRGRWSEKLPACVQCHGPNGMGVGTAFPPLAGLPGAYIVEQLDDWKAGKRPAGPLGLMAVVAQKLSADDVKSVAAYFAALAPAEKPQ